MAADNDKSEISDTQVFDFIESARGDYNGVPFELLGSSKFFESRKELQRGSIYTVVDDDPLLDRLISALE